MRVLANDIESRITRHFKLWFMSDLDWRTEYTPVDTVQVIVTTVVALTRPIVRR